MNPTATRPAQAFLPDFCGTGRVVDVLVICQLVAVVLALSALQTARGFWFSLFLMSLYLQWIGIFSVAALCLIRRHLGHLNARLVAGLSYTGLLAVTFALSEIVYLAGPQTGIAPLVADISHQDFLIRNLGVCAVVSALGLRYFWLRDAWQRQAAAEAEARYQALQARIRPHFLFNCLNSIAALVAMRPADAERAIEDLSDILRASLADDDRPLVTLREELELVDAYTRIEGLRLGDRLILDRRIEPSVADWSLPPLSLQPLVENAIRHGIEKLPGGGRISIEAVRRGDFLAVSVTNPRIEKPDDDGGGLRLALANIEQRLALRYGGRASLQTARGPDHFSVVLNLPAPEADNP